MTGKPTPADKGDALKIRMVLDDITKIVTGVGAIGAALAMLVLFAAGLVEVWKGAIGAWRPSDQSAVSVVTRVIHGVEMLLLAPVAYLVFSALGKYVRRADDVSESRQAHRELLGVKAFIAGLLFAVIATDAVGKSLEGKLSYELAIANALLMTALGGFFFILERFYSLHDNG